MSEAASKGALISPPVSYLPQPLLRAERPVRALATAFPLTFIPSIILAVAVALVVPEAAQPKFPFEGLDLFVRLVLVAPAIETVLMSGLLLIFLQFLRPTYAVLGTALAAGLAHSFAPNGVAMWGLVIWWPFLIFSTLFVVWRQRSLLAAFAMPFLAHALHNLPTAGLLVAGIKV